MKNTPKITSRQYEKLLLKEKLKNLSYESLQALEKEYQSRWNTMNEELGKMEAKEPSIYADWGYTKKDLEAAGNYYISIHTTCLEAIEDFKEKLFGPDPLKRSSKRASKRRFANYVSSTEQVATF